MGSLFTDEGLPVAGDGWRFWKASLQSSLAPSYCPPQKAGVFTPSLTLTPEMESLRTHTMGSPGRTPGPAVLEAGIGDVPFSMGRSLCGSRAVPPHTCTSGRNERSPGSVDSREGEVFGDEPLASGLRPGSGVQSEETRPPPGSRPKRQFPRLGSLSSHQPMYSACSL